MTEQLATIMSTPGEADVIAALADRAAAREVVEISDDLAVIVLGPGQSIEPFELEQYAVRPNAKRGDVALTDADSFVAYVKRHMTEDGTTIWANLAKGTGSARVVAVIDDHSTTTLPGWGRHRATMSLQTTPDWDHWLGQDNKWLSQDAFAEHIEDGADAIREPVAATMLEIAENFHARHGVNFKSTRRLSGEVQFQYEENTNAQSGELTIPTTITLGLAPFEGGTPYAITARFRYRLANGNLSLGYRLIRPDRVRKAAFTDVATTIAAGTDLVVMNGAPRP